jgi:putative isomerase
MTMTLKSPYLDILRDRIDLETIPFTDRGSRLLVFKEPANCALFIRLAERWAKWEGEVGPYRQRKPLLTAWRFTDGEGNPLDFSLTTWPHLLRFRTALGDFEITFLDAETLFVSLPAARCGFTFQVYADTGFPDRRGGRFKGNRNTAYSTNAHLVANTVTAAADGYFRVDARTEGGSGAGMVLNITPRLGFNRSVPPAAQPTATAAQRWHDWFAAAPQVEERYRRQYYYAWWVMRAGLIGTRFYTTREVMLPSKIHYVGAWQWDAYFHALAYRHVDTRLAEDQLRILLDHQREDGMIPDAIHDEGVVTHLTYPVDADVTKPPLIAWAAMKLYESSGHRDFLEEVYEPITRWNDWWFSAAQSADGRDGLAAYAHPFSSGLDDSPLWDGGMPVVAPDLNTYLVIQMESLARMADIIGEREAATNWRQRAAALTERMIAALWDESAGLFWATRAGQPIRVLTPFSLYPLWTGRLPAAMAARLVAHLTDPAAFWAAYPIPTVALNDPKYNPEQMWRGPTWVNINYLFIEALRRNGNAHLARLLRERTMDIIMSHDDIYEYYNPQTGERPPKAAPIFGWSSAVFIDLAIQASQERRTAPETSACGGVTP